MERRKKRGAPSYSILKCPLISSSYHALKEQRRKNHARRTGKVWEYNTKEARWEMGSRQI